MSRVVLPFQTNLLAYPGRLAGFDPSHSASAGISGTHGFSGVASGTSFTSLAYSKTPTAQGVCSAVMQGSIGPSLSFTANTTILTFSAPTNTDSSQTIAGIAVWVFSGNGKNDTILHTGGGSGVGAAINVNGTNGHLRVFISGAGDVDSNITLTEKVPYFLAASYNSSVLNVLAANLQNGTIITSVVSGGSTSACAGQYYVGNDPFANYWQGKLAAAMFAPTYLSLPQLKLWAQDPWAFWYPRTVDLSMMIKAAAAAQGFVPYNPWPLSAPILAQ